MKSSFLLTAALSLAYASTAAHLSADLHKNDLAPRVWGNAPGDRGYDYRDDPDWRGNRGGRISSDQLMDEDREARMNARDPPPEIRPAQPPSVSRHSTSSTHRDAPAERPKRDAQVKKVRQIKYAEKKKYPNGDESMWEVGAEFPMPKQGPNAYVRGGGEVLVNRETFAPGGRVSVTTNQLAGVKTGFGPLYFDTSRTLKQDQNPAPQAPPPRPQPVSNPTPGQRNTYYMNTREGGRRGVYVDDDGNLRSENSGKRISGNPPVYRTNPSRRSKRNPGSVLGTIETTTNAPANSSDSLSADWQAYYSIYTGLRTNATNLLMPIFKDLVSRSNTSYAYEMAWSIHSQLTGSPNDYQDGPYLNGLADFDDFTDNWLLSQGFWLDANGTIYQPANGTISNDTLSATVDMLTINDYLQTTYYATWKACVAAVNVTQPGDTHTLLENLVYYAAVVTATNDTSVLSENFYTIDLTGAGEEAAWFVDGLNTYW